MLTALLKQATNATRYSFGGLKFLLKSEFAARIEIYVFSWIFLSLVYLGTPAIYLLTTLTLFLILLAVESLNTAIEVVVDKISPEISKMAKHAKDLGSFAVMCLIVANIVHLGFVLTRVELSLLISKLPLLLSFIALSAGLYSSFKGKSFKGLSAFVALFVLLFIIATGVYVASDYFTGNGFDHKVLYHLNAGLGGAGYSEYLGLIVLMGVYSLIGLAVVYFTFDMLGSKKRKISRSLDSFFNRDAKIRLSPSPAAAPEEKIDKSNKSRNPLIYICLFFASFVIHPLTSDGFELLKVQSYAAIPPTMSEFEMYVQPSDTQLTRKKNIVVVYLEGLERTYFNQDIFPDLVPTLTQIEKEALSFTDVRQVYNTEWTVAGLVGTQCGVPMYTPSQGNTMNSYDEFVPNALCLGDILKNNGYYLEFMGGSDLEFAGKGKFFETHGFDKMVGKEAHIKDPKNNNQYSGWGLYDDVLLSNALKRFNALSKKRRPFGLFLLTVDTHPPRGHISSSCEGTQYQDGSNGMLNAVKCADILVGDFLTELKKSPHAKDTLIVVMSDHVSMNHSASPLLKDAFRRNLFFIIDPDSPAKKSERSGSVLDIAPTLLSLLGMADDNLGFGRSLFGDEPTLIEQVPAPVDVFLIRMGKLMKKELWSFPNLSEGIVFNNEEQKLNVGKRWISYPVVLTLDEENDIIDLEFNSLNEAIKDGYLAAKLPTSKPYLWVDDCKSMKQVFPENVDGLPQNHEFCAAYGRQAEGVLTIQGLENKKEVFSSVFKGDASQAIQ